MREFYHTSVSFTFLNGCNKNILKNVKVLCDGKNIPHAKKDNGNIAFYNLDYGQHTFTASLADFGTTSYTIDITENNSPEIIDTLYCNGSYARKFANFKKILVNVKENEKPISIKNITVTQISKVPYLRVIHTAPQKSKSIKLNGSFSSKFLFQTYSANNKTKLYFTGYDSESSAYKLQDPITNSIRKDTILKPTWILPTDQTGQLAVPINPSITNSEEVDLQIAYGDKKQTITAKTFAEDPVNVSL